MAERFASTQARRQGADRAAARQGRRRDEVAHLGARPQGDAAPQERARDLIPSREARRLPLERRRQQRAVHRRRRLGARHGAARARDSEYQALLPIRGKILNVQKASVSDMLSNAECASIIQVIGAGLGPQLRPRIGPLRQDHHHERRRCRRRAHPHAAADPVLPLHAADDRGGPRVRGRAAPPPRGRDEPRLEAQRDDLHLLGGRAAGVSSPG